MKSLFKSYELRVHSAYIIYLPNNEQSCQLAERAFKSCVEIGQPVELFEGFDGVSSDIFNIKIPNSLKNQNWIKLLKVTDHFQSPSEVAISLSHIALWVKCMELDKPIVVLEHDAIMTRPYLEHIYFNAIAYLGCHEQLQQKDIPAIPIHSSINHNWHFINRAHAYCIDPHVAKRLFLNVLDRGIFESADVMIKCDDVAIVQPGFYAYDNDNGVSTQTKRKMKNDHRVK